MQESPNLHLPSPNVEIEIMLAVSGAGLRRRVRAGGLCAGTSRLRPAPFRIARSGLVGNPVDLTTLASIGRESLLEVRRAGVHARPVKANEGRLPVNRIRGVEIAMTVPELSDLRRVESTDAAVGPVKPPLARLPVVETEGKALDMPSVRAVELDRVQLGMAVPHSVASAGAGHVNPIWRTRERMEHEMEAKRRIPQDRIEVMRAVVRRRWSRDRAGGGLLGLSATARGQENRKQESESHRVPPEQIK